MSTSATHPLETAGWGRRFVALLVDWLTCLAVAELLIALGVIIAESAVFTALIGGSFGKLVTRLRVVRQDGSPQPLGLIAALIRSVLVALVIPPLVFTPDGRGLHDMAAKSRTIQI